MTELKTIRLRRSILVDNEMIDNNCVVDATPDVAEDLIGRGWAEPTGAIERHPTRPRIDHYNTAPVLGTEVHPVIEGSELIYPDHFPVTEAEKNAQRAARADGPTRVVPTPSRKLPSAAEVADEGKPGAGKAPFAGLDPVEVDLPPAPTPKPGPARTQGPPRA